MGALPPPTASPMPALPEGWHRLSCHVLDGGRLAIMAADTDLHAAWQSDLAQQTTGETHRLATQATAAVWMVEDGQLAVRIRFPLMAPFPLADRFPDGRWLVTGARSDGSANARIIGAEGVERHIKLGDGIEHMKIDRTGQIWVGWFDEGVFGNDAWRLPDLEWPPSAFGIAAFDDYGRLTRHARTISIADCYALNVFGDEAWACTYADFPVWRMKDGEERFWPTGLSGVRAIAVDYPHVLAAGGYANDANRVVLLSLEEHGCRVLGEWRLPFQVGYPDGVDLIDARGDQLHVVHDQQWHRWRVADFVKAV